MKFGFFLFFTGATTSQSTLLDLVGANVEVHSDKKVKAVSWVNVKAEKRGRLVAFAFRFLFDFPLSLTIRFLSFSISACSAKYCSCAPLCVETRVFAYFGGFLDGDYECHHALRGH